MRPIISPRDLATAIGVSESSLKRWADDGQIDVTRTAGGHRRIAIGEAIRFIRATGAPLVRPHVLGLTDLPQVGEQILSAELPDQRLFTHLYEGKAREARGLVLSLYLAGQSVADIADGPIHAAMQRLGELWKHSSAGVFIEHRATDICLQAVEQLRHFVEPQQPRSVALGGAPSRDPYVLPSLLAATVLADCGWHAHNLGPDTPGEALLSAVDLHRPRLVWLSVSSIRDRRRTCDELHQIAQHLRDRELLFTVGGRALDAQSLPASQNLRHGRTMADLVAIANGFLQKDAAPP